MWWLRFSLLSWIYMAVCNLKVLAVVNLQSEFGFYFFWLRESAGSPANASEELDSPTCCPFIIDQTVLRLLITVDEILIPFQMWCRHFHMIFAAISKAGITLPRETRKKKPKEVINCCLITRKLTRSKLVKGSAKPTHASFDQTLEIPSLVD